MALPGMHMIDAMSTESEDNVVLQELYSRFIAGMRIITLIGNRN